MFDRGTKLYNRILFDKTADLLSKFNEFKELKSGVFVNPGSINKLDL